MSNIVRRNDTPGVVGSPIPATHPARPVAQGAESTANSTFEGTILTWEDMPTESRRAAHWPSQVVAEHVQKMTGTALKIGGVPHQRLIAWRAHEDRVVVATAVRPLTRRADGKLSPSGTWQHHTCDTHLPVQPPRRREGVVPAGPTTPSGGTGAAAPLPPRDQLKGADTTAYLPAAVRQGLFDAVPAPTLWLGEITQIHTNSYPTAHTISVLRLQEDRAAVVLAERRLPPTVGYPTITAAATALAGRPWSVTQMTYAFQGTSASGSAVGGTGQRRTLGGRR